VLEGVEKKETRHRGRYRDNFQSLAFHWRAQQLIGSWLTDRGGLHILEMLHWSMRAMAAAVGNDSWQAFLRWIELYQIGDLTSIAGILITLVGFGFTFYGVFKSKNAAQRAEEAARLTRNSIRLLDTVVDFSAAIAILEEVKRLHRTGQWAALPDRYAALRKLLVMLRATSPDLTDNQRATLQNALANLYALETAVERSLGDTSVLKPAKFNAVISRDIDNLIVALAELKAAKTGA
jgi:hypothetical protein